LASDKLRIRAITDLLRTRLEFRLVPANGDVKLSDWHKWFHLGAACSHRISLCALARTFGES
jgi:hypothetical protein